MNGNLLSDANKMLHILSYNYLNLPDSIDFENDIKIKYLYASGGTKLRQITYNGGTPTEQLDYSGSFVYENSSLKFIITSEGRLLPTANGFEREYFLSDHLGNTRVIFKKSGDSALIVQEIHYYAYGMEIADQSFSSTTMPNTFLYNGKEYDGNTGYYQYGFRQYDAQIGRWWVVDALAEKYYSHSPYNYCLNNPVNYIDPYGLDVEGYITSDLDEIKAILRYFTDGGGSVDNFLNYTSSNCGAKGHSVYTSGGEYYYYTTEVGYFGNDKNGYTISYNGATSFFHIVKNYINLPAALKENLAHKFDGVTDWRDMFFSKYNSEKYNPYLFTRKELEDGGLELFKATLAVMGGAAALEFAGYQIGVGLSKLVQLNNLSWSSAASFAADAAAQMTLAQGNLSERLMQWNISGSLASGAFKLPFSQALFGSALDVRPINFTSGNTITGNMVGIGNKPWTTFSIQTGVGSIFNFTGGQSLYSPIMTRNGINNIQTSSWLHTFYLYPNYIGGNSLSNYLINSGN